MVEKYSPLAKAKHMSRAKCPGIFLTNIQTLLKAVAISLTHLAKRSHFLPRGGNSGGGSGRAKQPQKRGKRERSYVNWSGEGAMDLFLLRLLPSFVHS